MRYSVPTVMRWSSALPYFNGSGQISDQFLTRDIAMTGYKIKVLYKGKCA